MLKTVGALIVVCVAVAVVGWQVTDLFVLTLVGAAGIMLLGAAAVRILERRSPEEPEQAEPAAGVRPMRSVRHPGTRGTGRTGGELGHAA